MNNKNLVAKSNSLVDAYSSLTVREHQFIAFAIASIERNDVPLEKLSITIRLDDFAEYFGLGEKQVRPSQMLESAKKLFDREITFVNGDDVVVLRWIYKRITNSKNGEITLHFSPDILPHLTNLSHNYTLYTIGVIKNFKCQHTFPIYELLAKSRNERRDVVSISIGYLRKKLGLENRYPLFKNFRVRVIEPIFADLESCTLLDVDYELIKTGRRYTSIQIIFKESPEAIPPRGKHKEPDHPRGPKSKPKGKGREKTQEPDPIANTLDMFEQLEADHLEPWQIQKDKQRAVNDRLNDMNDTDW